MYMNHDAKYMKLLAMDTGHKIPSSRAERIKQGYPLYMGFN